MSGFTKTLAVYVAVVGAILGAKSNAMAQGQYYYIRARHSGQCLNVLNSGRDNGDNVVQGDRCDTDNFQWQLIRANRGYYYIRARHSGQCLNVLDSGRDNGDNVVQGDRCDNDNFQWALIPASGDFNYIEARHSGQCLNVLDSGRDNGDNVVQGDRCDTDNFQWELIPVRNARGRNFDSGRDRDQEDVDDRLRRLRELRRR